MVSIQAVKATTTTTKRSSEVTEESTSTSTGQTNHHHHHHSNSPPAVLTRSVIPTLVTHLDASDVLECYYLTRQTVLSGSGGLNNITITKAAIGLRQKNLPQQTAASSSRREKRLPLQLTLEYGPSKDVTSQIPTTGGGDSEGSNGNENNNNVGGGGGGVVAESIPRVIWDEFTVPGGGDEDDPNNEQQQQQRIPVTVTWENEGRVYFTTDPIGQGPYTTANYLASVSGAVLSHLLQSAVDYTTTHARFRRYQPFALYQTTVPSNKQPQQPSNDKTTTPPPQLKEVLHSSSDVDFILYLYDSLATLGVSLEPILLPQHTQMRLHVAAESSEEENDSKDDKPKDSQQQQQQQSQQKSLEFVQVGKDVSAHDVAEFYAKLTSCMQALITADTSMYAKKQPNQAKNNTNSTKTTSNITSAPSTNEPPRRRRRRTLIAAKQNDTKSTPLGRNKTTSAIPTSLSSSRVGNSTNTTTTTITTTTAKTMPSAAPSLSSVSATPTTETNTQAPTTELPTRSPTTAKSESEQASQAAAQAQEAANQAEEAGNKPAAEAAQAAADAAQRAADVTVTQQALMHQKALLSGDAASMVATVALCFSDPAYGLAPPPPPPPPSKALGDNKNNTETGVGKNTTTQAAAATTTKAIVPTTAYLYWDGTFYFRVDLVPPYISVAPLEYRLPRPKQAGMGVTGDDFVDWSLALLIAVMFAIGLLLLLQQVSGRNFKIIRPLYRFQRWFFDPTHCDLQAMDDFSEAGFPRGMGREYTFGEDVIPLSMGGRRATTPTRDDNDNGHGHGISSLFASSGSKHYHHLRGQSNGDLELVSRTSSHTRSSSHTKLRGNTGGSSHHSLSSIDESERSFEEFSAGIEDIDPPPTRLFRDPDLVDLPNLTSTSKVAVPVSMVGRGSPSPPLDEY